MELRVLRYFVEVARELHFTRAAERLGIAQPPLSQQIARLETELGVKLFDRIGRGIALTEPGRVFLREAEAVLSAAQRAAENARQAGRGEIGRLRLGLSGAVSFHPEIRRVLRSFTRASPGVETALREAGSAQLQEAVADGSLDAALLLQPVSRPPELAYLAVAHDDLAVAFAADRLAEFGDAPALADFAAEPFVTIPRDIGPGLYDMQIAACRHAGFSPLIRQTATRMVSAIHMVSCGMGVALAPAWLMAVAADDVAFARLDALPFRLTVELAYRRGHVPPAVRRLVRAVGSAA